MTFQELLMTLERFWAEQGCLIVQPYDIEVGAGTFNPATLLRALGPEPWNVAYVEPSPAAHRRPLRRKPQPPAALLSVPGHPQALSQEYPGTLSGQPAGPGPRPPGP